MGILKDVTCFENDEVPAGELRVGTAFVGVLVLQPGQVTMRGFLLFRAAKYRRGLGS